MALSFRFFSISAASFFIASKTLGISHESVILASNQLSNGSSCFGSMVLACPYILVGSVLNNAYISTTLQDFLCLFA